MVWAKIVRIEFQIIFLIKISKILNLLIKIIILIKMKIMFKMIKNSFMNIMDKKKVLMKVIFIRMKVK
jgi:hypothetical protein